MADSVETIKASSDHLAGSIADELAETSEAFAKDTTQVLKFHGIYQQDDRDSRRERLRAGLGKDVVCMVRASIPGGVLDAQQYLAADALADEIGATGLRITTRQGLQWHFVKKHDLARLIGALNDGLITTLAACGDVVRNVMACPAPLPGRDDAALLGHAARIAQLTKPRASSYWDLWLDGERAVSALEPDDELPDAGRSDDAIEPLYGATYLPRKFKIGFAYPGDNCVDVYTNDIGIVPNYEAGRLTAFTVLVGGGLGMSHNNPSTFPRLADPVASVAPDELDEVVTAIIAIQRDEGERADRKHARMKYLVEDWGISRFRAELHARLDRELAEPETLEWEETDDHLGWHQQYDGHCFLGVQVPSGRVADTDTVRYRSGLRAAVERFATGVRFTPQQDVLLTGLTEGDRGDIEALLADHGIPLVGELAPLRRHAMACPALPTCGLALAEAERTLPALVGEFESRLEELGLAEEAVHLRVTGCPNGCARPYSTEIGVVGRGKDHYTVYLGGAADGSRLNRELVDRVALGDLVDLLTPVLTDWRDQRDDGEQFGTWCDRLGIETLRRRYALDGGNTSTPRSRRTEASMSEAS